MLLCAARRLHTAAAAALAVRLLLTMLALAAAGASTANDTTYLEDQTQSQPQPQPKTQALLPMSTSPVKYETPSDSMQHALDRFRALIQSGPTFGSSYNTTKFGLKDNTTSDKSLSKLPPARVLPVICPTGGDVEQLSPGVDLAAVANTEGKTYVLQPGDYFMTSVIALSTPGNFTCYQGAANATRDVVRVLMGSQAAFFVSDGAGLGLQNLLLDGQGSGSAGVRLDSSTLELTRVTMQQFKADAAGAAIFLSQSGANITDSAFTSNTADRGGAMYAEASNALMVCGKT